MADDRYGQQPQTGYAMADTSGGQQRSDEGQGRAGGDQYGSTDPSTGRTRQGGDRDRDDDDSAGFTSKVKGTSFHSVWGCAGTR
jgi:hypothetical protein